MKQIREAAVAGQFYPADANELEYQVHQYLDTGRKHSGTDHIIPKALVVPHAGYVYSAPIAASAFSQLLAIAAQINHVVLLGPSHRVPFYGIATSSADSYRTPLGDIPLDQAKIKQLEALPQVKRLDQAHQWEHSLEVELPFLQQTLGEFTLLPLVVGEASASEVAEVLDLLWGKADTLIVVSSDLSHYHDYATARKMDARTASAIESLDEYAIKEESACGRNPLKGLLRAAHEHHLKVKTLDLRNSGDTAGPRDQVVGYGAWVFYP